MICHYALLLYKEKEAQIYWHDITKFLIIPSSFILFFSTSSHISVDYHTKTPPNLTNNPKSSKNCHLAKWALLFLQKLFAYLSIYQNTFTPFFNSNLTSTNFHSFLFFFFSNLWLTIDWKICHHERNKLLYNEMMNGGPQESFITWRDMHGLLWTMHWCNVHFKHTLKPIKRLENQSCAMKCTLVGIIHEHIFNSIQ